MLRILVIPDQPYNPETSVIPDQTYIPDQAYTPDQVYNPSTPSRQSIQSDTCTTRVGNNNSPTVTPQFFYLLLEIKRIKLGNYGNRCFEILEFKLSHFLTLL